MSLSAFFATELRVLYAEDDRVLGSSHSELWEKMLEECRITFSTRLD